MDDERWFEMTFTVSIEANSKEEANSHFNRLLDVASESMPEEKAWSIFPSLIREDADDG